VTSSFGDTIDIISLIISMGDRDTIYDMIGYFKDAVYISGIFIGWGKGDRGASPHHEGLFFYSFAKCKFTLDYNINLHFNNF